MGRKAFGHSEKEREVVELIKLKARKTKAGKAPSLNKIACDLNAAGYRTRAGKFFFAQTVKNILSGDVCCARKTRRIKKTALSAGDYLSTEQIKKIFAAAGDEQLFMMVTVMLAAGLRASELCALEVRDLGVTAGKGQVDIRRGKGAKQRSVLIPAEIADRLAGFIKGRPQKRPVFTDANGNAMGYKTLWRRIKKLGKEAGIERLHPHAFRHTFATLLYHNQKDLFFVRQQLGHASVETTEIYAKTLDRSKFEQLSAFGGTLSELAASADFTAKGTGGVLNSEK
jgi:integrase